jgi:hypothetical protein
VALIAGVRIASAQTTTPSPIAISYSFNPNGNQTAVTTGGTIEYGQVPTGTLATATVFISNLGTSASVIKSASTSGAAYKILALPLLPAVLAPGKNVSFSLVFSPTDMVAYQGTLTVSVDTTTYQIGIAGTGSAAAYQYQFDNGSGHASVSPNGTISFPSVAVNTGQSSVTISVQNTGNASGQITIISISGASFQLGQTPILPITLAPNQTLAFTVQFLPRGVGDQTGQLRIENAQFVLDGTGLGYQPTVVIRAGSGSPITLTNNAVALLPNTSVGAALTIDIQITNTGNQSGNVTLISLVGQDFSIPKPPALPAALDPGVTLELTAILSPSSTGTENGVLQVDGLSFTLRAAANPPPGLPGLTFTGVSANVAALQQPAVGIQLGTPYPYDLTGKLTLTFNPSTFADDPAIQFAAGGRSITFQIPANSVNAVFSGSSSTTSLQTGTTAGTITLSANITVANYNLTQTSAPSVTMTIPSAAPAIRSVTVANKTTSGFDLLITGYSNTRSLSTLNFQIAGTPGSSLGTTSLSADVNSAFTGWYQSSESQPYGTQFTVSVHFAIAGDSTVLASISTTATNSVGASSPQSSSLQ